MTMNRSEFIRNHPKLGVADLIQEAAKKGLEITNNLVYNIRSKDRKAADATGDTPVATKKKAKVATVKAEVIVANPTKKSKKVLKKVSKKAKVATVVTAAPVQTPVVVNRGPVVRNGSGSKMTVTVTVDVHDPSALKNSKGLISSLFSG